MLGMGKYAVRCGCGGYPPHTQAVGRCARGAQRSASGAGGEWHLVVLKRRDLLGNLPELPTPTRTGDHRSVPPCRSLRPKPSRPAPLVPSFSFHEGNPSPSSAAAPRPFSRQNPTRGQAEGQRTAELCTARGRRAGGSRRKALAGVAGRASEARAKLVGFL
jgi:hypothetical protein